jgi:hypothetical protein
VAQGKEARGVGSQWEWPKEAAPRRRRTGRVGGCCGVREAARRAAIYSQEREVRLQAFVVKDSRRYCCGTAVVPWEAHVHRGRPRADRWVFAARPTGEGEHNTWQERMSRGRGAWTGGRGPASACARRRSAATWRGARARPALWPA